MLWAFKMTGCMDCGFRPTNIEELKTMHCDHRNPDEKTHFANAAMSLRGSLGAPLLNNQTLLEELWKCDPVCAECHRVRTRERGRDTRGQIPLPLKEWIAETTRTWGM